MRCWSLSKITKFLYPTNKNGKQMFMVRNTIVYLLNTHRKRYKSEADAALYTSTLADFLYKDGSKLRDNITNAFN